MNARRAARFAVILLAIGCGRRDIASDSLHPGDTVPPGRRYDQTAVYVVPNSEFTIAIERAIIQRLPAEYWRVATIYRKGAVVSRVALFMDTGGYSRTNLYALPSGAYYLKDAADGYLVDLTRGTIVRQPERATQGDFLGSFDTAESGQWRFFAPSERGEKPVEYTGG